jgi:hypothetical protein
MGLKLQEVPAAAGMRWVSLAFNEFFRYPLAYAGVFASFLFAVLLASLLPFVGGLFLLMSVPMLTLAFMIAVRISIQGERPKVEVFVRPWQRQVPDRRRPLLALLLFYAALIAGSVWVASAQSDGGFEAVFAAYAKSGTSPEELNRLMESPGVAAGMLWCVVLISLISLVFWFAPALVYWAGQGPAQALFSSTLAMWRARWAFLNYGVVWIGCSMALALVTGLLAGLLGSSMATMLLLPLHLMLTCVFYVSLYFSFVDCFGEVTPALAASP